MDFEQISPMYELCSIQELNTEELRTLKKERKKTLKPIQPIMDIQESEEILSPLSIDQLASKPQQISTFTGGLDTIQGFIDKEIEEQKITNKENDHFLLLHRVKMKLLQKKYDKQHVNPFHLNLLSDLSSGYTQNFKEKKNKDEKPDLKLRKTLSKLNQVSVKLCFTLASKLCHKFKLKIVSQLEKIPLIDGDSIPKIIWDFLITIVRLYFLFMIPLQVFPESLLFYYINVTIGLTTALLVDQIMSFNTIFYELGQPVSKRYKITQYVIKQDYGLQMVSILQLLIQIILQDTRETWLQYLFILFFQQFKKIQYYINNLQNYMNLNKQQNSWIELFKLLFTIMYIIHCFGCIWFYSGWKGQEIYGVSWLEKYNYLDIKQSRQYLISIYYSTTTMSTVGYGDITPQNDIEIIISMIFMMTCSIMMSYIINTVGTVINEIQTFSESNRKNIQIINKYMQHKFIGYQLQFQIRQYLNYYVDSHWDESNEVNEIIGKLSENLRERLQIESNQKIIEQIPFFKNFSSNLMTSLVKSVKQITVQPDNWISFDHDQDGNDQFLYFIEKGTVAMTTIPDKQNNHFKVIKKLEQSSTFGLENFIFGNQSIHAFRSFGFGRLLLLSRNQFLKALENNPSDLEIFQSLKDRSLSQGKWQIEIVGLECLSCRSLEHQIQECSLLHYIPDRERVIKSHQYSRDQNRNEINKSRQKKSEYRWALSYRQIIAELADIVQFLHPDSTQIYESKMSLDEDNQQIATRDTEVQPTQEIQILSPLKKVAIIEKMRASILVNRTFSDYVKQKNENQLLEIKQPNTGSKLKMHTSTIKKKIKSALFFYKLFRNSRSQLNNMNDLYNQDQTLSHKRYRIQKDEELVHYQGLLSRQDRRDSITNYNDLQLNDLLMIKMKKLIHGETDIDQFEHSMEFKIYYPQYNQEEVIYINNRSFMMTNKTQTSRMSKLVKYLFYPGEFLNRNNEQKIKIERSKIQRKNNVISQDNKQLLIEQKEEKLKKFNGIIANRKQEILKNQKKQQNLNSRIYPLTNSIHQHRKSIARVTWKQANSFNDNPP